MTAAPERIGRLTGLADAVKALVDALQGQWPLRQEVGGVMSNQAKKVNTVAEPLQTAFYLKSGVRVRWFRIR